MEPALRNMGVEQKNRGLERAAKLLVEKGRDILKANAADIETAKANHMNPGLVDRLLFE